MRSLLLLSQLSVDPAVPLFGAKPYPYGEGAVPRPKKPCTQFGIGGQDPACGEGGDTLCAATNFDPPPTGHSGARTWWIYDDPTWDFGADEPRPR